MLNRLSVVKFACTLGVLFLFVGLFGQAHPLFAADRTVIGELWSQDN